MKEELKYGRRLSHFFDAALFVRLEKEADIGYWGGSGTTVCSRVTFWKWLLGELGYGPWSSQFFALCRAIEENP